MSDINGVFISGRITSDSKYSVTTGGTGVAKFGIATNRAVKQQDGQWGELVSYFDCVLFGKGAENLSRYLIKGKGVSIKGTLRQDRWEKEGKNYSKVYIVVDEIHLESSGQSSAPAGSSPAPAPVRSQAQLEADAEHFVDDGIPF